MNFAPGPAQDQSLVVPAFRLLNHIGHRKYMVHVRFYVCISMYLWAYVVQNRTLTNPSIQF